MTAFDLSLPDSEPDDRYRRRIGLLIGGALGLVLALGAVVVAATILSMVVVGPLLGGGRAIAHWLGLGVAFEIGWGVARWPIVLVVATGFLTLLYRLAPNAKAPWGDGLPGAMCAMAALVLVLTAVCTGWFFSTQAAIAAGPARPLFSSLLPQEIGRFLAQDEDRAEHAEQDHQHDRPGHHRQRRRLTSWAGSGSGQRRDAQVAGLPLALPVPHGRR